MGAETFQASVNTDWMYSIQVNHYLKDHPVNLNQVLNETFGPYSPFLNSAEGNSILFFHGMGHYAGSYYAILLEWAFPVSEVMALSLTTGLFFFSMPLAFYFLVCVGFNQSKMIGVLATVLFGMSSPIAVSFLYYLVGQNSGLPLFFIGIAVLFIAFTKPSFHATLFAALILSILSNVYSALLPFVGLPIIILLVFLLVKREVKVISLIRSSFALLSLLFLVEIATRFSHIKQGITNGSNKRSCFQWIRGF